MEYISVFFKLILDAYTFDIHGDEANSNGKNWIQMS